jgi:hypothetical protein
MARRRLISSYRALPWQGTGGTDTLLALRCQPPGDVDVAHAHRLVLVVQGLHHEKYGRFRSFLGGDADALALVLALPTLDDEASALVLQKGQRPVMVAMGRGRRFWCWTQETKRPRSLAGRPSGQKGRTHANCAVSLQRRKPRPNLGRVCIPQTCFVKMRRIAKSTFFLADQTWTDSDHRASVYVRPLGRKISWGWAASPRQ